MFGSNSLERTPLARPSFNHWGPSLLYRSAVFMLVLIPVLCHGQGSFTDVTTAHNDPYRTGWQQNESILNKTSVSQNTFGLLWQYPTSGAIFAQPLTYTFPTGTNLTNCPSPCEAVFIATETDMLYAFNANLPTSNQIWSGNLAENVGGGYLNCQPNDLALPCGVGVINPYMGITGTPVIDSYNQILYVVTLVEFPRGTGVVQYYLHAVSLSTGKEMASPLEITASASGQAPPDPSGTGLCTASTGGSTIYFDPTEHIQRAGLLLYPNPINGNYGTVYVAFAPASNEYENGWLMGYQYIGGQQQGTLSQTVAIATTPNGTGGGIWEGGGGIVAAAGPNNATYVYAVSGNGTFDTSSPRYNYGDSVLRLNPTSLAILDFFTPGDETTYTNPNYPGLVGRCPIDEDLNSGGLIALPDDGLLPNHPHLAVVADKEATLYVVDRDNLGQFVNGGNQVIQVTQTPPQNGNVWGYWGNTAYYNWGLGNRALYYSVREQHKDQKPFPINQYSLTSSGPISALIASTPEVYCGYGAVPSVSSNGVSSGGVLWAIEATNRDNPGSCPDGKNEPGTNYMALALHAYDATQINATPELYNGRAANINDLTMGFPVKFSTPTVSNGKVFVGSNDQGSGSVVNVFGLCGVGGNPQCMTN